MLVLTRKAGEKVVTDQGITLTILEIAGSRVRVGIDTHPERSIRRGELNREWKETFLPPRNLESS
jgi:carbon storage regulator